MKTKLLPLLALCCAPVWAQTAPSEPGHEGHDHAPGQGHEGHNHGPSQRQKPGVAPQNESNADYFWRKSDEAFHAGDYERAVGLHRAIVALDPTDIESFSVASWLLWSMQKVDESNAHIARGLEANPKDPEMWDAAGQHYDLQKRFADSKKSYAKAVELSGKDAPQLLRRRLAHASEKSGDLSGSVSVWQGLVKDFPGEVVNKNNLARVQKAQQEAQKIGPVAAVGAVGAAAILLVGVRRFSD